MKKTVPFLWVTFSIWMVLLPVGSLFVSSASTTTNNPGKVKPLRLLSSKLPQGNSTAAVSLETSSSSSRVKRGYYGEGRSYSTGIAYNRVDDAGQLRSVGDRHRNNGHGEGKGGGGRRGGGRREGNGAPGEDGTHINDFKSYGVGYEHHHSGRCEESKCGYNIRHCPHGCVFNSFLCGGGAAYDTCCC